MKAAIINNFGSVENFEISEVPMPGYSDDELLIKIHAASVNPVDWKHRKGNHKYILGKPFPIIFGYDFSGIVAEKGKNINQFEIGDKVYGRSINKYGGTYSEYTVSPASILSIIPDGISFEQAAAIPLAGITALQGLRDFGKINSDKKVLINGASSGVGHLAVQISKLYKANTTAICSTRNIEFVTKLLPDKIIDYTKTNIKRLDEKYDVIFDVIGNYSFFQLKHLLSPKGIYVTTLPRPKVLLHKLLAIFTNKKKAKTFLMKSNSKDLKILSSFIENKQLFVQVDKIFKLENIQEAHLYGESGKTTGKIVIKI